MIDVLPLEAILGRPEAPPDISEPLRRLEGRRVLVTGASGSIGSALCPVLQEVADVHATDVSTCDVRAWGEVAAAVAETRPYIVIHLAGAKSAPDGELCPTEVAETNIEGTANVLAAAGHHGARVVTASTCKACAPETVYGASKLIAERMTLNAGGSVARYYNVVETCGNVFAAWRALPEDEPIPVTECRRFFISLREAVSLTLWAAVLGPGRFVLPARRRRFMPDVAAAAYPGRRQVHMDARRGDRIEEPRMAPHEAPILSPAEGVLRVHSPHDPPLA